jgi:hypothetical protein
MRAGSPKARCARAAFGALLVLLDAAPVGLGPVAAWGSAGGWRQGLLLESLSDRHQTLLLVTFAALVPNKVMSMRLRAHMRAHVCVSMRACVHAHACEHVLASVCTFASEHVCRSSFLRARVHIVPQPDPAARAPSLGHHQKQHQR